MDWIKQFLPGVARKKQYWQKILNTQPTNLIGYWRLNEAIGTVALDSSPENNNGSYTGVTLANAKGPDGILVPYFDGTNDFVDIYSAGLASDFNVSEGTMSLWCKVSGSSVWTDATNRCQMHIGADSTANFIRFLKTSTDNTQQWTYVAGGTDDTRGFGPYTDTDWFHLSITWSATANAIIVYKNGIQVGATMTGLGTWVGTLGIARCVIGSQTNTSALPWHGWLAHASVWNTPLTPSEILALAKV